MTNTVAISPKTSLCFDILMQRPPGIKLFANETLNRNFIELTPFNKGNLWKVRLYKGYCHVFYGTVKKAYATDLSAAIKFIIQFVA